MSDKPFFLMTDPSHYGVFYEINPWMKPKAWDHDPAGLRAAAGQTIAFTVLMLICAVGMWLMRYWAVLGFMALLAILVLFAVGALVKASSVLGLVIALAIVGAGGFLFFKLVRVLSRLQMPKYPGR